MSPRMTPVDILNMRFRRRLSGYAIAEVDDFVRRVASDMEACLAECHAQREQVAALERELAQYRAIENTMRDALIMAQKAADETRIAAHAQAETLVHEAQLRASEQDVQAQMRQAEMSRCIEALRQERLRMAREWRAQLSAQLAWLDEEMESALPTAGPTPEAMASGPAGEGGEAVTGGSRYRSAAGIVASEEG